MQLPLDTLAVEDLDIQILAGTSFLIINDISLHPARQEVLIQSSEVLIYNSETSADSPTHAVHCTQSFFSMSSLPATVFYLGDFLELDPGNRGLY